MDHPRPWLRYVEADDLQSRAGQFELDGMDVDGEDGHKLGKVDGFVVDAATGRPYYVVVDAGGWFTSKLFLLPIGHVAICLLYTSPSPRDRQKSRMPSSA